MTKKVLDIGQCDLDHSSIADVLNRNFDVEIHRASSRDAAFELMNEIPFDLVLINRILDKDGTSGMEILKSIKGETTYNQTPVMIVSNFQDAQDTAVDAGAVAGFGKNALNASRTVELLRNYL